jgi:hypothetical protein
MPDLQYVTPYRNGGPGQPRRRPSPSNCSVVFSPAYGIRRTDMVRGRLAIAPPTGHTC